MLLCMHPSSLSCVACVLLDSIMAISIKYLLISAACLAGFLLAMAPNVQHAIIARISHMFRANYFRLRDKKTPSVLAAPKNARVAEFR